MEEYKWLIEKIKKEAEEVGFVHDAQETLPDYRDKMEQLLLEKLSLENIISFKTLSKNKHERIYDVLCSILGEVEDKFLSFKGKQLEEMNRGAIKLLLNNLFMNSPSFLQAGLDQRLNKQLQNKEADFMSIEDIVKKILALEGKLQVVDTKVMVNETLMKVVLESHRVIFKQDALLKKTQKDLTKTTKALKDLQQSCFKLMKLFKNESGDLASKLKEVADNATYSEKGQRALKFCSFQTLSDAHSGPGIKRKSDNDNRNKAKDDKNKKKKN